MSRRVLVLLVALGLLATVGGVAGGLMLARGPGPAPAAAGPTTLPETTAPVTSEPGSSTSSTGSSSTTSSTAGLTLRARVVQRLEDGVVVSYVASEAVTAVLAWGFGGPSGHQLRFPGPAAKGTLKLALDRTTRAVSMRVTGQSADGRAGSSDTLTARRLVGRVVLEVQALSLDIPRGTGGIATGFRGTTYVPLGPDTAGPTASSEPYAFPSTVLGAGERSSPLALRFFHQVRPDPRRTQVVNLAIPLPRTGGSTLTRDVTAIGVTAHLRLRVTVTLA
ncbi:MAG TPA: hypothetical protein VGS14_05075 [Actinomycetes bacterium]|jgi:hypothetical protein|nr:hypothetical protein [Actinomycetes bacterium]